MRLAWRTIGLYQGWNDMVIARLGQGLNLLDRFTDGEVTVRIKDIKVEGLGPYGFPHFYA